MSTRPSLTLEKAEKVLQWPAKEWAGKCFAVASKLVECKLVDGVAVYGHFLGSIHPQSMFAGKLLVHHGWVNLTDGGLLDPTRWVFAHCAPFLYWSPTVGDDYDEGGNRWREEHVQPPPPMTDSDKKVFFRRADLPPATQQWLAKTLGGLTGATLFMLSMGQVFWLANLPLTVLGIHAKPLFEVLEKQGKEVAVPIDNFRRVKEGRWPFNATPRKRKP